jgi:hypothetical protein
MTLPVTIPNTFANATTSIPLANLDANFVAIYDAVNGIGNGSESLANVSITGGSVSNATLANANVTSGNATFTTANVTTLDATNVEVTNIKAKDGTAAVVLADSTGAVSISTTLTANGGVVFNEAGANVDFRVEGDTDANLLFVDASADKVGIGTSSPSGKLDIVLTDNGNIDIRQNASASTGFLSWVDSDGDRAGRISYDHSSNALRFATAASGTAVERMRIDSSGNVLVGITTARANAGDVQVSKGISFPATQSASSDANTLDDYEEGTAAVTLSPETSGTITVNTTQDSIAYTKVGRQVTIIGQVQITSVSNPVGAFVHLNSLPFVSADLSELSGRVGGAVTFFDDNINTYTAKGVLMLEGGTQMRMYVDASTVAANDGFVFSFSYFTT